MLVFCPMLDCVVSSIFYSNALHQYLPWTASTFNLIESSNVVSIRFLICPSVCGIMWEVKCCQLQSFVVPSVCMESYERHDIILYDEFLTILKFSSLESGSSSF